LRSGVDVRPGRRAKVDIGKLLMVPLAGLLLLADLHTLASAVRAVGDGPLGALRFGGTVLTCAFFAVLIAGYLRRGPPVATHRSWPVGAVAVIATLAPFPFPLLNGGIAGTGQQVAADVLLLAGNGWAVWALWCLGRNISVIPQARRVTDHGPYRIMRHPLYAGELAAALGLAVAAGAPAAFAVWLGLCAMQVYRALAEEQLLLQTVPEYREYQSRTAAFLPGLF
jgi:protein-S-isoprenylcysteine O-methyltransferase Ste14